MRVAGRRLARLAGAGLLAAALACGAGEEPRDPAAAADAAAAGPAALLPDPSAPLAPSRSVLEGADGATLADVDTCGGCHPDVLAQQQASAHAYSSFNNPVYRVAIDRLREETGPGESRMCGGCHDIALLADGAMEAAIEPEDDRGHAGVTCRVCHGIEQASLDGNGSYTLARRPVVLPRRDDPASVEAHRASVRPLRSAAMCGSCHRSFLDEGTGNPGVFLTGQDDLTAWLGSAYNGSGLGRIDDPVEKQDCAGCHMPREPATRGDAAAVDGTITSHRFLGGHTWMAAMLGDEEQLAAQRALLEGALSIDLAALRVEDRAGGGAHHMPADGAPAAPGDTLLIDVVVRNLRVGHRFPAGVVDAQDSWIELDLVTAGGRPLARAGGAHAATGADPSAHQFRSLVADGEGRLRLERETHAFRGPVVNHTIAPRDAVAVRYRVAIPRRLAPDDLPLALEARVVHRSRNLSLQRAACAAHRSPRGARFTAHARALDDPVLDPCAPQPLTLVAQTRARIGAGAPVPAADWRRRYEHGMALLAARQEHLEEARAPLMAALAQVVGAPGAGPRERAMILVQLGHLEGKQGRADEAAAWLDRAEALMPGHPAIAHARGAAMARVWRWAEAAEAFGLSTAKAPDNAAGWADLAMALGSLGREQEALAAARRGLALAPRHADCLRVQALALRALGRPDEEAAAALEAYDQHRPPDQAAELRIECARRDPLCALERDPVHVHDLVPVRARPRR